MRLPNDAPGRTLLISTPAGIGPAKTMTTDPKPSKEQIYDDQISPLMKQILEIAKANGIAMLAHFDIESEEDPGLRCTTTLPNGDGNFPDGWPRAMSALKGGSGFIAAIAITSPKS